MRKIAIIDDDSIFQLTTKAKLKKLDLADEVMSFSDGEEAFEFLRFAEPVDLPNIIFLDINMPIVDGWDFIEMFKTFPDDVRDTMKIFMLSSSINPVDLEKADETAEVTQYLTKPISDNDLISIWK